MRITIGDRQEVSITFNLDGLEMLRLCSNGDIYVKGILTSRNVAAVNAFKEFVMGINHGEASIERHETLVKKGK